MPFSFLACTGPYNRKKWRRVPKLGSRLTLNPTTSRVSASKNVSQWSRLPPPPPYPLCPKSTRCAPAMPRSLGVGVLDHNQDIILVRRHHNFVLRAPQSQKGQAVGLIQRAYDPIGLEAELADECRVRVRVLLAKVGAYWNPIVVQDQYPLHPPVGLNPLQRLLYLGRHHVCSRPVAPTLACLFPNCETQQDSPARLDLA